MSPPRPRHDPAIPRKRWPWTAILAQIASIVFSILLAFWINSTWQGRQHARQEATVLDQVHSGIVAELGRYEVRALEHAEGIRESIEQWRRADRAGQRAVPDLYRIPGATHPPTAAWDAAVSSGVARRFDPDLRLRLGYFYTEFVGIHDNYARYLAVSEREILPLAVIGPDAFYNASGRLLPEVQVHMSLLEEFSEDLRRMSAMAGELRATLLAES